MKQTTRLAGQRGFTIIESTLFLAISGALVLVAILGTGAVVRSVRFTDSVRSTQSFVQSQYSEILDGVNPRQASTICGSAQPVDPGKGNCLLLGKLVHFQLNSNTITSYYVVSEVPDLADPGSSNESDVDLIARVNPEVVQNVGVSRFNIPWGAEFFGSKRVVNQGGDGRSVNSYMVLRSPQSSRLVSYTFTMPSPGSGPNGLTQYVEEAENTSRVTNFCIRSEDDPNRDAALQVAGSRGNSAVEALFEVPPSSCNGTGGGSA